MNQFLQERIGRKVSTPDVCDGGAAWLRVHPIHEVFHTMGSAQAYAAACEWSKVRVVTFLRDPVERALSEYFFFHAPDACYFYGARTKALPIEVRWEGAQRPPTHARARARPAFK